MSKSKRTKKTSKGVVGARKVRLTGLQKILLGGGALVNAKPKERK